MILLDRTMATPYRLSKVTSCSSLAAIFNAMLLPAAITHVRRIAVLYHIGVTSLTF